MKYYIKRLASGIASVSFDPVDDYDFVTLQLPEGDGILMVTEDGELYREGGYYSVPELEINEMELLKQQVEALTTQTEFQSDLIAEMANIVYV